MSSHADPYRLLRCDAAPADEICSCSGSLPVVVAPRLDPNPLACIACNLQVPPDRIGFPAELVFELASFRRFHNSFYCLWLDSGEFEAWAKAQLTSPDSTVNQRGVELTRKLAACRPAYYWWFHDDSDDAPACCPVCLDELVQRHWHDVCERCLVSANRRDLHASR